MKKSQWYIFSGVFFFFTLIFAFWARIRKTYCIDTFPKEVTDAFFNECMQRYGGIVVVGFICIVLTIVFFILGLFEK